MERFEEKLAISSDLEDLLNQPVDVVDLRSAEPFFIHQVMQGKELIIERSPYERVEFEVQSRRDYFDRLPFYRLYHHHAMKRLEEYLRDLDAIQKAVDWNHFSQDKITRRYVERTLHIAIEACLDIANHIISYEGYREPRTNKDSFEVLKENGIIDVELNEKLKKMAQFRNVIVHDYVSIQPEIVYAVLTKHTVDISRFAQRIHDVILK